MLRFLLIVIVSALIVVAVTTYLVKRTIGWIAPEWATADAARHWSMSVGIALAVLVTVPIGPLVSAATVLTIAIKRHKTRDVPSHRPHGQLEPCLRTPQAVVLLVLIVGVPILAAIGYIALATAHPELLSMALVLLVLALLIVLPFALVWFYAAHWNPRLKMQIDNLLAAIWRSTHTY
jgi:hypothetical protein